MDDGAQREVIGLTVIQVDSSITHIHVSVYVSDKSFEKQTIVNGGVIWRTITRVFLNKFRMMPILSQSNIC